MPGICAATASGLLLRSGNPLARVLDRVPLLCFTLIVTGSLLGPRLDKNIRELEEFRASFEAPLREAPQDEALLNAINNTPSC
jgi:hypothetical protein